MGTRAGVARAHCHSSDLKEGEIKTGASKTSHLTAEQWTARRPAQALRFSSETALFYLHSSAYVHLCPGSGVSVSWLLNRVSSFLRLGVALRVRLWTVWLSRGWLVLGGSAVTSGGIPGASHIPQMLLSSVRSRGENSVGHVGRSTQVKTGSSAHLEMSCRYRGGPHHVTRVDLMLSLWETFAAMREGLVTVRSKLSSRPPSTHPSLRQSWALSATSTSGQGPRGHNQQLLSKPYPALSQLPLSAATSCQSAFSYLL